MTSITGYSDDDDDTSRARRRRSSDQASLSKTLGLLLAFISFVGLVFTAGYNWRSVANIEKAQEQFSKEYVRQDVQQEQLRNVTFQLGEISKQLEEMRLELRAQRRKGTE